MRSMAARTLGEGSWGEAALDAFEGVAQGAAFNFAEGMGADEVVLMFEKLEEIWFERGMMGFIHGMSETIDDLADARALEALFEDADAGLIGERRGCLPPSRGGW